jgi:ABC-type protease/lipase transport system fused ATPase/permease subunit
MTTTRTISREHAKDLLWLTANTNLSGVIGSANSGHYTIHQALSALARCTTGSISLEVLDGMSILKANDTMLGQHRWYVRTTGRRNPWS